MAGMCPHGYPARLVFTPSAANVADAPPLRPSLRPGNACKRGRRHSSIVWQSRFALKEATRVSSPSGVALGCRRWVLRRQCHLYAGRGRDCCLGCWGTTFCCRHVVPQRGLGFGFVFARCGVGRLFNALLRAQQWYRYRFLLFSLGAPSLLSVFRRVALSYVMACLRHCRGKGAFLPTTIFRSPNRMLSPIS